MPAELPPAEKKRLKKVESILQKVEAEAPTDSRVEIITPRRPRPPTPPKPLQKVAEIAEESAEEGGQPAPPVEKPEGARQPEMVSTEIGPLPGDLWGLIGQPAPQSQPREAEPVEEAAPEAETPVPAEVYLWPEEEEPPEEEEEPGEVQLQPESAPAAGAAPSEVGEPGGDAGIEELARQVYREIKRRFTVELERFRRKK